MKILLEENEMLKTIRESIEGNKNIEIFVGNIMNYDNSKSLYQLLIIYCNSIEDIMKFRKIKSNNNILVVTNNRSMSFIYSLICTLHPLDVICANLDKEDINIRITSNIEFLRGEEQ